MNNEMTGTTIKRVLKKGGAKRIRPDIFENISDEIIDEIYTEHPYYGTRRMVNELRDYGYDVVRDLVIPIAF